MKIMLFCVPKGFDLRVLLSVTTMTAALVVGVAVIVVVAVVVASG